jgi:hypothetical protein
VVSFDYRQSSEWERMHSIMPGDPAGDLFGYPEWQKELLAWDKEQANAIGRKILEVYEVKQYKPDQPTTYLPFINVLPDELVGH